MLNIVMTFVFMTGFCGVSFSQDFVVPAYSLENKDDYAKYEQDIVKAANWLETTQIGKEENKRLEVNAFMMRWLTGTPPVSMTLQPYVARLTEDNPQLLMMFMAGYTRWCLENNYSKDEIKANTAGVKSMINLLHLGGEIKKNKTLQKAIEADRAGKLEEWVSRNYSKK